MSGKGFRGASMKGGVMWMWNRHRFGWVLRLHCCLLLCVISCGKFSLVSAAEPVAQIPLGEFKQLIGRVDTLQQREKLQAELIGYLREKDKLQTDYIAKMEAADEQRERYVEKLEQINNQLAAENKDKQLSTLAEGAGYGATAAAVIGVVVRRLLLKF